MYYFIKSRNYYDELHTKTIPFDKFLDLSYYLKGLLFVYVVFY